MKKKKKLRKKTLRVLIAAGIAFVLLIGVCIYTLFIRPNLDQETVIYMETQVQRGDLIQGIMENGSITMGEKSISYDLEINYEEDEEEEDDEEEEEANRYLVIEEIYVKQGQRISAGDPLLRFSEDSMNGVRRKLENARSEAQVELAEVNSEYDSSLQSAKSTYSASKSSADTASRVYNAAVNRVQEEIHLLYADIQVLEAEIDECNLCLTDEDTLEEYSDLKYDLELAEKKMSETGTESPAAYTANYSEYQSAKSAFEQLDSRLESYREQIADNQEAILKRTEQIQELQTSLEQSQTEAKQTYDSSVLDGSLAGEIYDYTTKSLQESVDSAAQEVTNAQNLLEEYEAFIGEDGIIYATEDGLVTSIVYEENERLLSTGALVSYVTAENFTISIDVSEEDISYINVGDEVDIAVNAYPDEKWIGIVSAVTTSADSGYSSTVNYPVTIHIQGDTSRLYGGMTADITFVSDQVTDVLYVSAKAVTEDEDGNSVVTIKNSLGKTETQKVTTGFSNGSEIEILEGVQEGENLYIAGTTNQDVSFLMEGAENGAGNASEPGFLKSILNKIMGKEDSERIPGMDGEMTGTFPGGGMEMPEGGMPEGFEMPGGGEMPEGFPGGDFEMPEGGFEMPSGGPGGMPGGGPNGNMSGNMPGGFGD